MSKPKRRFAALDTTFLLALAVGDENCEAVIDWLGAINVYALVTPTVIQELVDLEDQGGTIGEVAKKAKSSLPTWGFLFLEMDAVDHGIAKIIAMKLLGKGVLPDECENDGLVLAEAGLQECKIFVTFRNSILEADLETMKLVLLESDVSDVLAVAPADIVTYLHKKSPEVGKP